MGVLDVDDSERCKGSREQTGPLTKHSATDYVEQENGTYVGQRRKRTADESELHYSPISDRLQRGAQEDQRVDQHAAQGEPAGI